MPTPTQRQSFKASYDSYLTALFQSFPQGFHRTNFDKGQTILLILANRAKPFAESISALDGISFMAAAALQRTLFEITLDALYISLCDSHEHLLAQRYLDFEMCETFKVSLAEMLHRADSEFLSLCWRRIEVFSDYKTQILQFLDDKKQTLLSTAMESLQSSVENNPANISSLREQIKQIDRLFWKIQNWRDPDIHKVVDEVVVKIAALEEQMEAKQRLLQIFYSVYSFGNICVHSSTIGVIFLDDHRKMFDHEEDRKQGVVVESALLLLRYLQLALQQKGLLFADKDEFLDNLFTGAREHYYPSNPIESLHKPGG